MDVASPSSRYNRSYAKTTDPQHEFQRAKCSLCTHAFQSVQNIKGIPTAAAGFSVAILKNSLFESHRPKRNLGVSRSGKLGPKQDR